MWADGVGYLVRIEHAVWVYWQAGHFGAFGLDSAEGVEHGRVFGGHRDEVLGASATGLK
jgi:hypothetical protein